MSEAPKTAEILIPLPKAVVGNIVGGKRIISANEEIRRINRTINCKITFRALLPGRYRLCTVEYLPKEEKAAN